MVLTPTTPSPSLRPMGSYPVGQINHIINNQTFYSMEKNLVFNETLTVEQFKAQMNVSRIDVKQNPKTGVMFFTYGAKVGAVSRKGIPQNPMISHVKGDPTPENPSGEFYLLHEEGKGGAPVLASF